MAPNKPTMMRNDEVDRFVSVYPSQMFVNANPGILQGQTLAKYKTTHCDASAAALISFCARKGAKRIVNQHQWNRVHAGRSMASYEIQQFSGKDSLDGLQQYMLRAKPIKQPVPIIHVSILAPVPTPLNVFHSTTTEEDDDTEYAAVTDVATTVDNKDEEGLKKVLDELSGSWSDDEEE